MATSFMVKVVTPTKVVLEQEADFLLVRTTEGDMGILGNYFPLVAALADGQMKIRKDKREKFFRVEGGFIEISNNQVTILSNQAYPQEERVI